jgi:SAM-dependent methyltransferase
VNRLEAGFCRLNAVAHEVIDDEPSGNVHVADDMGTALQRELLPYLLLSRTAERIYAKPRGMSGDFLITKWICENRPDGVGRVGSLIDKCFLDTPMLKAVRNQRGLIVREILGAVEEKRGSSLRVTCLGCGPAEEIFDVFTALPDHSSLCLTLVDVDFQALASVSERLNKSKLGDYVKIRNANLVYLATNREKIDVGGQDLVYSTGMTNYFDDKTVLSLMNYIHSLLNPGGRVVLGNFHAGNPNKGFTKYVLNWHVYHRTEDDMHRLFLSSSFKRECTDTVFEDEGIIFIAGCSR